MTNVTFPITLVSRRSHGEEKRFTEEQIIGVLKEHESGCKVDDVSRHHNIDWGTFCRRNSKYAGMEVNEAKHLKELENENIKLKKLVAEAMLDNAVLKDVVSKKWLRRQQRKP